MQKVILLIFSLTLSLYSYSQEDILITNKGERYEGKISFDFSQPGFDIAKIKTKDEKLQFRSHKVDLIIFKGDTIIAVPFDNKQKFGKVLIKKSRVSLLMVQLETTFDFDTKILVKDDNSSIALSSIRFKKPVSKFLADCDQLSKKVLEGELTKSDLSEIISLYEECNSGDRIIMTKETDDKSNEEKIASLVYHIQQTNQLTELIKQNKTIPKALLEYFESNSVKSILISKNQ